MPQMAPISWLSLFILFSLSFMMFNMMNYFSFNPLMPKSKFMKNKSFYSMNWKW
nr:ATP synthase F0 subunit 8 [Glossina brevipalpis]